MHLRKDRAHIYGATNLDFRTTESTLLKSSFPNAMTHIDLLSIPKKNFDEVLKSKYIKLHQPKPSPFEETYSFYKEKGKPTKEMVKIGKARDNQLERPGGLPFTGESNLLYDERVYSNYKFDKLIKEKKTKNENTTQETQLTGLGSLRHETLQGKVDLEKIKEIRRILRRKYGARGNFQKIFNQWDNESKGAVSVHNLFDMLKKFGINVNLDEARVLVASADHDRSNDLNLDEFLELIFTDNEALNVDLTKIPVLSENEKKQFDDLMRNELTEAKMKRHHEQMNYILKNKLNQIARVCFDTDYRKTGKIDYNSFHHHLRQLGYSEKLLPDTDIQYIYEKYKDKQGEEFNYPAFLRELKDFEYKSTDLRFEKIQTFIQKPKELQGLSEIQKRLRLYDVSEPEEFLVLDNQKINVSKLENQRLRAKKVFREIYRKFPNKKLFEDYFQNYVKDLHSETNKEENLLSKEELKNFIQDFFVKHQKTSDNAIAKIQKKDLEGFLTNFTYNSYGETVLSDIPSLIYDEEDKDYYKRLGYKTYGPLPSKKHRFANELKLDDENKSIKENTLGEEEFSETSKIRTHHKTSQNKKLDSILEKIEQRFFSGTNSALEVFRCFDKDNSGYVTQDNLIKKIKEINLLPDEEIPTFLNYLDPDNKGVLNFQEFSSKIRPLALKTDAMGRQTIVPNVAPDKEQTNYLQSTLPLIKSSIFDSKLASTPQETDYTLGATRYGSSPVPVDTFPNFQANTCESPMFISPKIRFQTGLAASLEFQKEEKKMKDDRYNAKLNTIRSFDESLKKRINDQALKKEKSFYNQLKMKGLAQWSYEHRNHLKNDWN